MVTIPFCSTDIIRKPPTGSLLKVEAVNAEAEDTMSEKRNNTYEKDIISSVWSLSVF